MFGGRKALLWIDERAKVFEPVSGHQARGSKLPQPVFNDARQLACVTHEVRKK
jgi:hypothetical protein